MPNINRSAIVPYTASQMYSLVNDVSEYPHFLPGCVEAKVLDETPERMRASLKFGRGGVHAKFTTDNALQPGASIDLSLVEGPFAKLEGRWEFNDVEGGCEVALKLLFAIEAQWLASVFSSMFVALSNDMVDLFCARAKQIYGK